MEVQNKFSKGKKNIFLERFVDKRRILDEGRVEMF